MERTAVQSSNLKSVGYDLDSKTLEVEFQDASVYQYSNVPQAHHDGLMQARSKGAYLHRHIRNAYSYKRVKR